MPSSGILIGTVTSEMGGVCSMYEERRGAYRILVGKPEERRPVGRSRRRWEKNIRIGLREVEWRVMGWIDVVQDRDR